MTNASRLFLASDQIWPSAINRNYPGAKFVARCRLDTNVASIAPAFASLSPDAIWGVVIETDAMPASATPIAVVDDFGTSHEALIAPGDLLSGDPESLFMASRYWELPPSYIQQLREVLQAKGLETADDEPRDDGALSNAAPPNS